MKKLLFWMDIGLEHLGIAKAIQEKTDYEIYGIIDANNNQKEIFEDRDIINFEEKWFFWNNIKKIKSKIDFKYLKKFEEKYQINLWQLVYSERIFSDFYSYHKFSRNEILGILEQECKFFEKVLEHTKYDFLIIKLTDFHRNHLLFEMCKSKGIKILMLMQLRFGNRAILTDDPNKISDKNKTYEKNEPIDFSDITKHSLFKQTKNFTTGGENLSKSSKLSNFLNYLTTIIDEEYKNKYENFGKTRIRILYKESLKKIQTKRREKFINEKFSKKLPKKDKFIYFPLHVQPERNVDLSAPYYTDQLEVITNISKSLPIEYSLFVKEHFNMKYRNWRQTKFYEKILKLPNVEILHPTVNPKEILEKCSAVITISGSSGLEAALNKKPTIVLSDVNYMELSSVTRLKNLEELPDLIKEVLKNEYQYNDISYYLEKIKAYGFEFDLIGFHDKILNRFHKGGMITSGKISKNDFVSFYEENIESFETLANEHIKKINS